MSVLRQIKGNEPCYNTLLTNPQAMSLEFETYWWWDFMWCFCANNIRQIWSEFEPVPP